MTADFMVRVVGLFESEDDSRRNCPAMDIDRKPTSKALVSTGTTSVSTIRLAASSMACSKR